MLCTVKHILNNLTKPELTEGQTTRTMEFLRNKNLAYTKTYTKKNRSKLYVASVIPEVTNNGRNFKVQTTDKVYSTLDKIDMKSSEVKVNCVKVVNNHKTKNAFLKTRAHCCSTSRKNVPKGAKSQDPGVYTWNLSSVDND